MRPRSLSLVLGACFYLSAAGSAASLSLEAFIGTWQGQGQLYNIEKETQRSVRCILDGTQPEPLFVELKLKCASRQSARTLVITIEQSEAGDIERVIVKLPSAQATGFTAWFTEHSVRLEHQEEGKLSLENSQSGVALSLHGIGSLSGEIHLN